MERLVEQRGSGAVVHGSREDRPELLERAELQARGSRPIAGDRQRLLRVFASGLDVPDTTVQARPAQNERADVAVSGSSSSESRTAASTCARDSTSPETASAASAAAT